MLFVFAQRSSACTIAALLAIKDQRSDPCSNLSVSALPNTQRRLNRRRMHGPWASAIKDEFWALVKAGGDPCAALDEDGNTLLHMAAVNGLEELAMLLLSSKVGKPLTNTWCT